MSGLIPCTPWGSAVTSSSIVLEPFRSIAVSGSAASEIVHRKPGSIDFSSALTASNSHARSPRIASTLPSGETTSASASRGIALCALPPLNPATRSSSRREAE